MLIRFHEEFELSPGEVYGYFRTPQDWPRLFGAFGNVQDKGDGWYAVPLRRFPFPLIAKVTTDEPERCVRWTFRGFWCGEGEVRFTPTSRGVRVQGHERITVRPLFWLAPLVERVLLERRFTKVWESGWRRLRTQAASSHSGTH